MTIKNTRIANLNLLAEEFGSLRAVAEASGKSEGYLSLVRTDPKRGIGHKVARDLEVGCKKPKGWMDVDHDESKRSRDLTETDVSLLYRSMMIVEAEIPNASLENKLVTIINLFCSEASKLTPQQIANAIKKAG